MCTCISQVIRARGLPLKIGLDENKRIKILEAFAMDDGGPRLVVLLLRDPHLLECRERSQNRAANPHRVLALWRGDDFNFHCRGSKGGDFLLHTVGDARVHGGAPGEDGVGVKVFSDVHIALHNRVIRRFVNTGRLHTEEGWLE